MTATLKSRKSYSSQKIHSSTKKRRKHNGGNVIAAGSFGCVFRPSLTCDNSDSNSNSKSSNSLVSKLGEKTEIKSEYDMMVKLHRILKSIPDSSELYGLDVSKPCIPSKLSRNDLVDFDKKCKLKDLNEETVNDMDVLPTLSFIDMPYGGVSLLNWIRDGKLDPVKTYVSFIHGASRLIRRGIVPMNRKGVLHNDIHARNILVKNDNDDKSNDSDDKLRFLRLSLIDWGLAVTNTNTSMKKIVVQIDYPITRIFFVVKAKKPLMQYVRTTFRNNNITKYTYDNSSLDDKRKVYEILLKVCFELVMLSQHNEKESVVKLYRQRDILFKSVLFGNKVYTNTYIPFLKSYISTYQERGDNSSMLYDKGITFTSFVYTMYLVEMMHKYLEIKNSDVTLKFRKYFTDIYRFNADVYAMSNCIILGTTNRYGLSGDTYNNSFSLAKILLEEVFLKSVEVIDFTKLCNKLDDL